jgi:two-component system cell cycle sensor histidine kinase/response regulator CckA
MGTSRVLVVEDEPQVRSVVKAMLERGGMDVVTADHPDRALEIIEAQPGQIALVLSGMRVRGMSGPKLVREVMERSPGTAVALMTGATGHEDEVLGLKIPVLQKPIPLEVLIKTVQELLQRQKTLAMQTQAHIQRSARLVTELQKIGEASADLARMSSALVDDKE